MGGYELLLQLEEETPKSVPELAEELNISESEIEHRFEYLEQYSFAERTSEGILDTGNRDEFKRS